MALLADFAGQTPIEMQGTMYYIKVRGNLDSKWADWFGGFVLTSQDDGETLLQGTVADQAALHGVLDKINHLGLLLILVARVDQLYTGKRCPLCGHTHSE